jgi:hypothetical protein
MLVFPCYLHEEFDTGALIKSQSLRRLEKAGSVEKNERKLSDEVTQ